MQDERRITQVLGFGASYIRDFTVLISTHIYTHWLIGSLWGICCSIVMLLWDYCILFLPSTAIQSWDQEKVSERVEVRVVVVVVVAAEDKEELPAFSGQYSGFSALFGWRGLLHLSSHGSTSYSCRLEHVASPLKECARRFCRLYSYHIRGLRIWSAWRHAAHNHGQQKHGQVILVQCFKWLIISGTYFSKHREMTMSATEPATTVAPSNRACHPGGLYWYYFSGSLSSYRVTKTHLKIGYAYMKLSITWSSNTMEWLELTKCSVKN